MRLVSQATDGTVTVAGGAGSTVLALTGRAITICIKDTAGASYNMTLADSDGYVLVRQDALTGDASIVCEAPCVGNMTLAISAASPDTGSYSVRVYTDHGFIF